MKKNLNLSDHDSSQNAMFLIRCLVVFVALRVSCDHLDQLDDFSFISLLGVRFQNCLSENQTKSMIIRKSCVLAEWRFHAKSTDYWNMMSFWFEWWCCHTYTWLRQTLLINFMIAWGFYFISLWLVFCLFVDGELWTTNFIKNDIY